MSDAVSVVGTLFKRGDGASSEAFVSLGEITGITQGGMNRDTIDVTNLGSTGGYREFITSFRDSGEFTLQCNYVHDAYETFKADFEASASVNYQIVVDDTDASTFSFAGFVTAMPVTFNTGEQAKVAITIKVTGEMTLSS